MADQTPSNDPLGNRLRATFSAERDDIERRHIADGATPARTRSLKWIPFAVAAAVIAIAGFAFIGNRTNDQAVELDISAQDADGQTLDDQAPDGQRSDDQPPDNQPPDDQAPSGESPVDGSSVCPAGFPYGVDTDNDGVVDTCYQTAAEHLPITTPAPSVEPEQAAPPTGLPDPEANTCSVTTSGIPHFVWDVLITDPDGGLIAHTAVGVNEPSTRVIGFDQIVTPTGGCSLAPNGARWYELQSPGRPNDWVNARFLRAPEPACLRGQQFGTRTRNGQHVHVIAAGDRLGTIAIEYGIAVEELVSANPQLDPNLIVAGEPIWIPGLREERDAINGVFDGWAVADGDSIAFSIDSTTYRWYLAEEISVGTECFPLPTGDDSLEALPCLRVAAPVTDSGRDPLEYLSWPAGAASSTADHVHDIRTESNEKCTRIVVTFGDRANEDSDAAAATLPPIVVDQGLDFVRISPNGWAMESAFMDTDRVNYPRGIGLLTLSPGFEFAVELMHTEMEPNVRFFDNPARVVIDLFPVESPDPAVAGPFGERFVLRQPIQIDPTGQGIPVDNDIVVEGFGRPFEAAGLYRIWAVADDVDPDAFLADPPEPLIEEFFPTSGWAEGWGTFSIDLPDLEPGSYIAVFGELPPTDEIGFYGTGQLFRVADAATEEPGSWPEAVLLPDVQLPPE